METDSPVQQRINFIEDIYRPIVYQRSWLFSPEAAARSSARFFWVQLVIALLCLTVLLSLPLLTCMKGLPFWEMWDQSGLIILLSISCILSTVGFYRERLMQRHRLELTRSDTPETASHPELAALNDTFFTLANHRDKREILLTAPLALLALTAVLMNEFGEKPPMIWRYMVVGMPVILAIVLTRHIRYARRLGKNIAAFTARLTRQGT